MNGKCLAESIMNNKEFEKHYESETFWHGKFSLSLIKDVFSWEKLNEILSTSRITNDRLRLAIKDKNIQPNQQAFRLGRDSLGRLTDSLSINELHRLASEGVTGILESVNELEVDIRRLTETLSVQYFARSAANAYFSFGSTSGFGAHYDDHDVIVLQTEGEKKWRFFGVKNISSMATIDHLMSPTEENVSEEIVVTAGDVLFVPKGTWHDVVSTNQPSLHLTISLVYPVISDYIQWLMNINKHGIPGQDIKIFKKDIHAPANDCKNFFSSTISGNTIATFLQFYYSRFPAVKIRPSFPSLNKVDISESFERIPFSVANIRMEDCSQNHMVHALGRNYSLSDVEYKILENCLPGQPLSGFDITVLFDKEKSWENISVALQCLLEKGLISKS